MTCPASGQPKGTLTTPTRGVPLITSTQVDPVPDASKQRGYGHIHHEKLTSKGICGLDTLRRSGECARKSFPLFSPTLGAINCRASSDFRVIACPVGQGRHLPLRHTSLTTHLL
jgi:hypothetical protein